jgi:hypothetical protein
MREALGRLNSELYPPLKEQGFEIRSQGPSRLPPLIDATRRSAGGRSDKFLLPPADAPKDDKVVKPEPKKEEKK